MSHASSSSLRAALPRRLDKLLADAQIASRRTIEGMLAAGRVTVDGLPALEPWRIVFPAEDAIALDGAPVQLCSPAWTLALNKPCGFLTTLSDPGGRPTVAELLPEEARGRVGPVGRLDNMTSGLLLLTDDGDLQFLLTHPRHHVPKRYIATVALDDPAAPLASDDPRLERLRAGVCIAEGQPNTLPAEVEALEAAEGAQEIALTITEGRNRQIRRMIRGVRLHLLHLRRTTIGPLRLGDLPEGACRLLDPGEIDALYAAAGGRDLPLHRALEALRQRVHHPHSSPEERARLQQFLLSLDDK